MPQPQLAQAVHTVLGAHQLPDHLPPGLADELPEGPGVYRFFGEDDVLLYVGRSHSLRTRVCRHFAGGHADSKDHRLGSRVRRVDWVETAGELGAMLRNAEWIRTQRPLFNPAREPQGAAPYPAGGDRIDPALGPAQGVEPVAIDAVDLADLMQCFGVFHSAKDARKALGDIAGAQRLCRKALGLEDGAGSCFAYNLGKCRGACMGKEPLLLHGARLKVALASLKFKTWPFPGRIACAERDPRGRRRGIHAGAPICTCWITGPISARRAARRELAALRDPGLQRCLRRRCVQDAGPLTLRSTPGRIGSICAIR